MTTDQCLFPLFHARFLSATKPYLPDGAAPNARDQAAPASAPAALSQGTQSQMGVRTAPTRLGRLDLRALAREDGAPTEVGARRMKMAAFERKCSEIMDRLFVSGEWVAKDLATIQKNRITHIINCVAALYPSFHEQICTYKNIYLQGAPGIATMHAQAASFARSSPSAISFRTECSAWQLCACTHMWGYKVVQKHRETNHITSGCAFPLSPIKHLHARKCLCSNTSVSADAWRASEWACRCA